MGPGASGLGYSLVELVMAVAIFSIVVPVIVMFFSSTMRAFNSFEAANGLKKSNQQAVNRIFLKLSGNKRLFQNTANDTAFLLRVSTGGCPSKLTGSKLAKIEENGVLSPGTTNFVSASVGNSLFFAGNAGTRILGGIVDGGGLSGTVRIDAYTFNYYYLTPENPKSLTYAPSYCLVEWQSGVYADCNQVSTVSDPVKNSNTIKALISSGVNFCWNPSETNVSAAFSAFGANGTMTAAPSHYVAKNKQSILTSIITGIIGSGYKYGISSNSAGWTRAPKVVPVYAAASGSFPGGFEIAVVGPSGGRKVLIRSVIVAQVGNNFSADEKLLICDTRDIW